MQNAIELLFKVQSAWITLRVTQIGVVFLRPYHFCEVYSAFNGISHCKLFAIFFQTDGNFIRLYCHMSNESLIKIHVDVIRDKSFRKD